MSDAPRVTMFRWKLATFVALVVALIGVVRNGTTIEQVCATVQQQLDRNAGTVSHGLDNLRLIRDHPLEAARQQVPGTAYYSGHPVELTRAITNARRELATYKTDAC